MKTLLSVILLISTLLYSQENIKKDKIISKMKNSHNCFITYLDDDYVMIKSDDGSQVKFYVDTIANIEIDGLGSVYSESSGFSLSLDSIGVLLIARNKEYAFYETSEIAKNETVKNIQKFNDNKNWFFAVYYFPSISKQLAFTYIYSPYFSPYSSSDFRYHPQIVYELEQNLISMESQLGFNVHQNLFITLSVGYSSDLYKSKSTSTNRISNSSVSTTVIEEQNSMDKYLFEFGIKQYFGKLKVSSVSPFITFSIGKQLAFVNNYNKNYQVGHPNIYYQINNESEFLEGLNSPIIVSVGFGAEYAITESLSLAGFFKVKYSSASSTYIWKNVADGTATEYGQQDVDIKDVKYKTGIGLLFFF